MFLGGFMSATKGAVRLSLTGLLIATALCDSIAQTFEDKAAEWGVSAIPNSLQYGSGMSFYDFDEDGWDDLSFTMVDDSVRFYRNTGSGFELLPSYVYGEGRLKHLVWVDYDNDGDLDIGYTTFEGKYFLLNNDGNFNFTDVSEEAGLIRANERHYGMCFGDYNRDGLLDMYVTVYEQLGDESYWTRLNHLYRNNGDGTFDNVTEQAGVGDGIRLSFKGVWMDYNLDGWPDLFVINDRVYQNSLYHNNGDGTFTDVSEAAGIQLGGQDPMTATVGDFDNDGDLDIYMTNTNSPFKRGQLLVNNGDGTFSQLAAEYGVDVFGWTWGAVWIDYDNDTDQDLYVGNGHPNLSVAQSPNFMLENQNGLFFDDISATAMDGPDDLRSYSVARGDFDNDGYYDIGVLNRAPHDVNLWKNAGGTNNYIKITLTGTASNRMAIGSWIRVYINGNEYTQYTLCGENYIAQNSQHHIIGAGDATVVDSVKIEYNRGHVDAYYSLPVNNHYYFTEGDTYSAFILPIENQTICEGDSVVLDAGDHETYLWNTGHDERYLTVYEAGEYWAQVTNQFFVTTFTDTVSVLVSALPQVEQDFSHPLCHNDSTGWISLTNATGIPASVVSWSNGMQGDTLQNLPSGNYEYVFTDTNGCASSGLVVLQNPFPLSVQVFTFPEITGNDGEIQLIINGGTPPYTVFLNEEEVSQIITDLSPGVYTLLVVDANGCETEINAEVGTTVELEERDKLLPEVYPNPVRSGSELNIRLKETCENCEIVIYNATGNDIIRQAVNTQQLTFVFSTSGLSSGAYLLQIVSGKEATFSKSFILE